MTLDDVKDAFIGVWAGENILRLSWLTPPEYKSAGELTAATAIKEKFLTITYQWSHEDTPHEGLILIGFDAKQQTANASWADSWHSNTAPILLKGTISDDQSIDLRGTYQVPNHLDWGWRIVLAPNDDALQMTMYNISPEGEENLAVQAAYKRVLQ